MMKPGGRDASQVDRADGAVIRTALLPDLRALRLHIHSIEGLAGGHEQEALSSRLLAFPIPLFFSGT